MYNLGQDYRSDPDPIKQEVIDFALGQIQDLKSACIWTVQKVENYKTEVRYAGCCIFVLTLTVYR